MTTPDEWTPTEIAEKLTLIRSLPKSELAGWHRYCTGYREPFPGEIAALMQRGLQLGVTLTS